jgi:sulfate/thiosulfate transport system substrate-binding protein
MSLHRRQLLASVPALALSTSLPGVARAAGAAPNSLLNVSYDVSREFYKDVNAAFAAHWNQAHGQVVTVHQSHGGSSRQARSVIEGLAADVVTMNQHNDIDVLHRRGGLVAADWARRLPFNSSPTTSLSVILVRRGNPKAIRDWSDLARSGVSVIVPNPKTSGNGRYSYLAAWGAALASGSGPAAAQALVTRIFANVPVLDGGGRGATTTFAQRQLGDALVTFESEVPLITREFGDRFELVIPSRSILAENPVALVDKVVQTRGSRLLAEAYLRFLYTEAAQEIAARHHLRPRDPKVLARHAARFPKVQTFSVEQAFGGWSQAQKEHFDDGATYDRVILAAQAR